MTLIMLDSIYPANLPDGADAYLGYVNGRWPTLPELKKRFPHASLLSLTVSDVDEGEGCDCETGDLTPEQVPGWLDRAIKRGVHRPVAYANASTIATKLMPLLPPTLRHQSRLLSAHYGAGEHICGPDTCKYPGVPACDGTQWTDTAAGLNGSQIDKSALNDSFFTVVVDHWRADGLVTFEGAARRHHTTPERMVQLAGREHHVYDTKVQEIINRKEWARRLPVGTELFAPKH